jgi:hypothetical protein
MKFSFLLMAFCISVFSKDLSFEEWKKIKDSEEFKREQMELRKKRRVEYRKIEEARLQKQKKARQAELVKRCSKSMNNKTFNNMEDGLLTGEIMQSLPNGYLVYQYGDLYFVPKFDAKYRSAGSYVRWRVQSYGATYIYESVGHGTMQVPKVHHIAVEDDECAHR